MTAALPRELMSLGALAQLELEVRSAEEPLVLAFMAVNDIHRIVPYDHAVIWRPGPGVAAVSGGITIDATQPQIRFFKALGEMLNGGHQAREAARVTPDALPAAMRIEAARWLRADCIRVPLTAPQNRLYGSVFLLRERPFSDAEMRTSARLGSAFGSAFAALSAGGNRSVAGRWRASRTGLGVAAILSALLFWPVHLSVLADAKVVAREPRIVAAPIDGVIREMRVRPNQMVAPGDVLWSFDDTELSATRLIAEKRVMVLKAEQARAEQSAFRDPKARAEITVLSSKLAEGEAEFNWTVDRLARTEVRAPMSGVLMFDDPVNWVGRPVKVGERVLSLADPASVRLEIALAVEDALVVKPGADVAFFMAVTPNDPTAAHLVRVSYDARLLPNQTVAFQAEAEFSSSVEPPRLGLTGTAKVYGDRVTLFYALFRKPLAALRRIVGF